MDIEYLLWLQGLRETYGGETFVTLITEIPRSPLSALIPGILFWCFDKKAGLFILFVTSFGRMLNQLIKDTFCVYRPWILDSQVQPTADTLKKASSFSMPSGHTQMATAIYGGLAYFYRKKYPLLIIPCVLIILVTGISRNFLGAHTPQDVLVAIIETVVVMLLADKLFSLIERDRIYGTATFLVGIIFCVAALVYITTKSYPVDYVDGKIIVDPVKAVQDSVDGVGCALGFLIGWILERRFVNFSTKVDKQTKIRRVIISCLVGAVVLSVIYTFKFLGLILIHEFLKGFLPLVTILFLAPLAFDYCERKNLLKKFSWFR